MSTSKVMLHRPCFSSDTLMILLLQCLLVPVYVCLGKVLARMPFPITDVAAAFIPDVLHGLPVSWMQSHVLSPHGSSQVVSREFLSVS